jgi:hypothetical protein
MEVFMGEERTAVDGYPGKPDADGLGASGWRQFESSSLQIIPPHPIGQGQSAERMEVACHRFRRKVRAKKKPEK